MNEEVLHGLYCYTRIKFTGPITVANEDTFSINYTLILGDEHMECVYVEVSQKDLYTKGQELEKNGYTLSNVKKNFDSEDYIFIYSKRAKYKVVIEVKLYQEWRFYAIEGYYDKLPVIKASPIYDSNYRYVVLEVY